MVMPFKSLIFRKETVLEKKDDLFKLLISEKIRPGIQIWVSMLQAGFLVEEQSALEEAGGGDYSDSCSRSIMHMCVKGKMEDHHIQVLNRCLVTELLGRKCVCVTIVSLLIKTSITCYFYRSKQLHLVIKV